MGKPIIGLEIGEDEKSSIGQRLSRGWIKQGAVEIGIPGEEVIVEGPNPGEMQESAAAAMIVRRMWETGTGGGTGGGEIKAGEEGFEGRIAVDEGREVVRGAEDVRTEGEEDRREEQESKEVRVD